MCILVAGCSEYKPAAVLDAIGDEASVIALADLTQIAKSMGESAVDFFDKSDISEFNAIARLKGVDKSEVAVVSYTPSLSAIIFSITKPKVVRRYLGKPDASDSFLMAYRISDETYFVADSSWVWLVDSREGSEGALLKVAELKQKRTPISKWKYDLLETKNNFRILASYDGRFVFGQAELRDAGLNFNFVCRDSTGGFERWLPENDWQRLSGKIGRIDPRNRVSLALGRINLESALKLLPKKMRFTLKDAALEDFDVVGPLNIAADGMNDFCATLLAQTNDEAERLYSVLSNQCGRVPGVNVERQDSVIKVSAEGDITNVHGTSYAGANMVFCVNLDDEALGVFTGTSGIGLSAIAVVSGANLDGRVDFIGSEKPFLETLIGLYGKN